MQPKYFAPRGLRGAARAAGQAEHPKCVVCSKYIPDWKPLGTECCSTRCTVRRCQLRARGEEPSGVVVNRKLNPKSPHSKAREWAGEERERGGAVGRHTQTAEYRRQQSERKLAAHRVVSEPSRGSQR